MLNQLDSLAENSTWTLVDRPKGRKVIPGRWVIKVKTDEAGNIEKYKARYVAKGFMQVQRLDFHETYAPTCKPETMRVLLALAAQNSLVLHQMDVKTAYLSSPLKEKIYMEQPEGFSQGKDKVRFYNEGSTDSSKLGVTGTRWIVSDGQWVQQKQERLLPVYKNRPGCDDICTGLGS